MSPSPRYEMAPLGQLHTEWRTLSRSAAATDALHRLADRDPSLHRLVHGPSPASASARGASSPPNCPTAHDLIDYMHAATGRRRREEAAALVRLMLREGPIDPLIPRFLTQALVPGLLAVATKLQWGKGGDWTERSDFFAELLSVTWLVLDEWGGQDRPYAVLDLLSAIRCRMRRLLFRAKELHSHEVQADTEVLSAQPVPSETDLEQLARILLEQRANGMPTEDVEVLYAKHVLGYSIAELATVTGRNRRVLYARRDRGQRRLCA
jgi:hypothetical protein